MARWPTGREAMAGGSSARYERHRPEHTLLYQLVDVGKGVWVQG